MGVAHACTLGLNGLAPDDLVLRQPVINTAVVQSELEISHTNAMKAIGRLVEVGALSEVGGRRRSILWQASGVLTALDSFAARAGRRRLGNPGCPERGSR